MYNNCVSVFEKYTPRWLISDKGVDEFGWIFPVLCCSPFVIRLMQSCWPYVEVCWVTKHYYEKREAMLYGSCCNLDGILILAARIPKADTGDWVQNQVNLFPKEFHVRMFGCCHYKVRKCRNSWERFSVWQLLVWWRWHVRSSTYSIHNKWLPPKTEPNQSYLLRDLDILRSLSLQKIQGNNSIIHTKLAYRIAEEMHLTN